MADVQASVESIEPLVEQLRQVPGLRVVLNHMLQLQVPTLSTGDAPEPAPEWLAAISAAAALPDVSMKVSAVFEAAPNESPAPTNLSFYAPHLSALWEAFGEDR